jgi:hypothetical protein
MAGIFVLMQGCLTRYGEIIQLFVRVKVLISVLLKRKIDILIKEYRSAV